MSYYFIGRKVDTEVVFHGFVRVLVICHITNHPKVYQLKATHIYYLTELLRARNLSVV